MTTLLRKAFEEAAKLSPAEQDALAKVLLADLEAEIAWESAFGPSATPKLEKLASEALGQHRAKETTELDPTEL